MLSVLCCNCEKYILQEDDDEKLKKKKQRKVKLEFHSDQNFRDDKDVYVWHYDPISWTKFAIGLLLGTFELSVNSLTTGRSVWRDRHLLIPVMAELASTGRLLSVVGGDGLDWLTICVGCS